MSRSRVSDRGGMSGGGERENGRRERTGEGGRGALVVYVRWFYPLVLSVLSVLKYASTLDTLLFVVFATC